MANEIVRGLNNVTAFVANSDNADYYSSHSWITNNYGTELDRKVGAFFFQNTWPDIQRQGLIDISARSFSKNKLAIESSIRNAGGDHDSYLARVDAEVKCDNKLKNELQLTSLSIPAPDSLPLTFGYNADGEVGYVHILELNDAQQVYITATREMSRYKIDHPGQADHRNNTEYASLANAKKRRKKELKALIATLTESQKLFKQGTFEIQDILRTGMDSELLQLVEGLIRAIVQASAAQARYARNRGDCEEIPFVTPNVQESILQSKLFPKAYETMCVYRGFHEQWKSFSGGTQHERKNIKTSRMYHGRKMTILMMKYLIARAEVLFDLSKPDAVNFLKYMAAKHEEGEANFRKQYYKSHDEDKAAYAHYKDITKNLGQAWMTNKPMGEIAKLEQEASQAWTRTRGYNDLQKVAIGSCTFVDLLNDTVGNYKLSHIVKG